jgi:hypothetical protein
MPIEKASRRFSDKKLLIIITIRNILPDSYHAQDSFLLSVDEINLGRELGKQGNKS